MTVKKSSLYSVILGLQTRIAELEAATPEAYIAAIEESVALKKEIAALKENMTEYLH